MFGSFYALSLFYLIYTYVFVLFDSHIKYTFKLSQCGKILEIKSLFNLLGIHLITFTTLLKTSNILFYLIGKNKVCT